MTAALIDWLWPYLMASGIALVAYWRAYASGKKAGRNEKEVDHAKERARDLERIKSAADARPSVELHRDPYNRDNR